MTADTWLGVAGVALGLVGVLATVWAAMDARRQRNQREKAVIAANAVIERTYGLLIGIKPFVKPLGEQHEKAIDDGLSAINERRNEIKNL